MSTLADEKPDANSSDARDGGWFDRHQKGAWIAAGATIVAALIAALVPVLASSGDDKNTAGGPAVVPTPSAPAPAPTTTPPSTQTGSPGQQNSSAPAGTELWKGSLLVDAEPKDLDAVPDPVGSADKSDVYMVLNFEFEGWNGARIAQWSGGASSLPGYQECSDAIGALGSRKVQLSKKSVLCVQTSDGNVVRLKVTALGPTSIDTRATFDAVIWNAG
jgi:hypothetical protein